MFARRETLNPVLLWGVVLLLALSPLFSNPSQWFQTLVVFSLIYVLGICVPMWFIVRESPVDLFTYLSVAGFFALAGPIFSSIAGSLLFSIPFYMEFPIDLSLILFTCSIALWFMVRFVRKLPFTIMAVFAMFVVLVSLNYYHFA